MRAPSLVALALAVAVPAASAATEHRVVTIGSRFVPSGIVIAAGDSLVLTNLDQAPHDLASTASGPDGTPRFRSDIVTFGQSSPVAGVSTLPPSVYPFVCTVHPQMTGLLEVTP